nr:hypothetical protein [Fischerella sp. JS2]
MNSKLLYLLTAIITVVPTIAAQAAQVELGVFKSVNAPEKIVLKK